MTTRVNRDRLVGHLEFYMSNMVDCFEEFVKKSMLVISVAVGTLVLMVMYIMKMMSVQAYNRQLCNMTVHTECNDRSSQVSSVLSLTASKAKECPVCDESVLVNCLPSVKGLCKETDIREACASFDEKFMQEVELCPVPKPCESCKQTQVSEDLKSARTECNPWLRTPAPPPLRSCLSKNRSTARQSTKQLAKRYSCCSLCCQDDKRNDWVR